MGRSSKKKMKESWCTRDSKLSWANGELRMKNWISFCSFLPNKRELWDRRIPTGVCLDCRSRRPFLPFVDTFFVVSIGFVSNVPCGAWPNHKSKKKEKEDKKKGTEIRSHDSMKGSKQTDFHCNTNRKTRLKMRTAALANLL